MNKKLRNFVSEIENKQKQEDTKLLTRIIEEESGFKPSLNGKIIGYGLYNFKYANGKGGTSIVVGFSPRKQNIAIYIMPGFSEYGKMLKKLGKHKTSKCCLYINKLADVNEEVLRNIIKQSVFDMSQKYECKNK